MEIQGYPNYLIYPDGRIYSKPRKGTKGGFKKLSPNKDGYLRTGLTNSEGKEKKHYVHRLVANPLNLPEVDHIDRNRLNNVLSNLQWVSSKQNQYNTGKRSDNKTDHVNISYSEERHRFVYCKKPYNGKSIQKRFKTITETLCFKYIHNLRIKAGHYGRIK